MRALIERVIVEELQTGINTDNTFVDSSVEDSLVKVRVISVGIDKHGKKLPGVEEGDEVLMSGKAILIPLENFVGKDWNLARFHDVLVNLTK